MHEREDAYLNELKTAVRDLGHSFRKSVDGMIAETCDEIQRSAKRRNWIHWTSLVTRLVQLGAVIWFARGLAADIESLQRDVAKLQYANDNVCQQLSAQTIAIHNLQLDYMARIDRVTAEFARLSVLVGKLETRIDSIDSRPMRVMPQTVP